MATNLPKKSISAALAAALAIATPFVAGWEGKRNDPYADLIGKMTVCYGETNVQMRHYTDPECTAMLEDSLVGYAKPVLKRNPRLQYHPYQLAAATSLAYNIGNANYARSTVARRFDRGDYVGACNAMLMWNRAGGRVVKGLVNRRKAERALCLTGL